MLHRDPRVAQGSGVEAGGRSGGRVAMTTAAGGCAPWEAKGTIKSEGASH